MAVPSNPCCPIDIPSNAILMEDMALYAERIDLQGMMQEYLKRVLLNKPEDPIVFLMAQIKKNPYHPPRDTPEEDLRSEDEKTKFMDCNSSMERAELMKEVFDSVEKEPGTELVSKARLIVTLNAEPGILLERFPKHVKEVLRCIARMRTREDGKMTLAEFKDNVGRTLRAPGGR
ncbi:unnamed protein product [Discosporangium mesarthrocarpum]